MHPDLERLRDYYEARERQPRLAQRYALTNPAARFLRERRVRAAADAIASIGESSSLRVLEVGCGEGGVIGEYVALGVAIANMHGVDVLPFRVAEAHAREPEARLACADGAGLPYRDAAFDLVVQYTAVSSIRDADLRRAMAGEMVRVVRPSGAVLWHDFIFNPMNPQTVGLRKRDVRALFPDCEIAFRRITLAPPIARRIVPLSWRLAEALENLRIFNSHYFAVIRKKRTGTSS